MTDSQGPSVLETMIAREKVKRGIFNRAAEVPGMDPTEFRWDGHGNLIAYAGYNELGHEHGWLILPGTAKDGSDARPVHVKDAGVVETPEPL